MDLYSILSWIVFGGVAGWIASLIMRTDAQQGAIANIVIGIIGAFLGGWLFGLLGLGGGGWIYSLITAVVGAVILIWIVRMIRR